MKPRPPDWRPYQVSGLVLLAALALNLYTGNSLWLGYTLFGCSVFLTCVGCIRHLGWRPPSAAAWGVGLTASLHYVGGSLSGLHQVGGPNGLYYVFPWWDNLVHTLGSAAVAVAAYALLAPRVAAPAWARVLLAAAVASLVGVAVELYEFAQFVFFGTVDQGFYTNTLLDLYYNLLGGVLGAALYAQAAERRGRSSGP